MKYHVTHKWDGQDLESAARRMGESEAIEMFCEKWDADPSFAADQVTKVYLYETLNEAKEHQSIYGGEILEIDDTYLEVRIDEVEGQLCVNHRISKSDIRRIV